jgi:hypothetical protein
MAKATYKPGQKAPVSDQYPLVGTKGGKTNQEVTSVKGEPLPLLPCPAWATATRQDQALEA